MRFIGFFAALALGLPVATAIDNAEKTSNRFLQACSDDGNWKIGRKKDCSWVSIKPSDRCGNVGDDGRTAQEACPLACDSCLLESPSASPSSGPSSEPTSSPSENPSYTPSEGPTYSKSEGPSSLPSEEPSFEPSPTPSSIPSTYPSDEPSSTPSDNPSSSPPSHHPSASPSDKPSAVPSQLPSATPSIEPSDVPSSFPSEEPFGSPPTISNFFLHGPFIEKGSSEVITIPDPLEPDLAAPQTDCPHLQAGLLDWHNTSTWSMSGIPTPTAGSDVTLPDNAKVVIRSAVSEALGTVLIPSTSELILGPGIQITASGFEVHGSLWAGSETCRIEEKVDIVLTGSRPADIQTNPRSKSYKGIDVDGGRLELHGKRYFSTWSRLAKTVELGDSYILLQHSVNWEPGQQIVLVTTAMKDSREFHQNEIMTVDYLQPPPDGVGAVVHLKESANYTHTANDAYQGEVGLLSRMISVSGAADDSEASDPDPLTCNEGQSRFGSKAQPCPDKELTGYGGHIIVHNGGVGYVEGVELLRMGQTNVLGRYPMHFHLLGDNCPGCYLRDSSIHHSFYRCISVHATNNVTVSENVAFDVIGYCYYLEDGIEEDNILSFNLAALIHGIGTAPVGGGQNTDLKHQSPDLLLPADATASGFYITNIHNNIIGNAASGGWSGFAFPLLDTPVGPSRLVDLRPTWRTGLTIDGNTAHSTGWWTYKHSAAFYFGGTLYYDANDKLVYNAGRSGSRKPCNCDPGECGTWCGTENEAMIRMTNTKAFLSAGAGFNSWSGRMEVIGYEAHDVGLGIEALGSGFWMDQMLITCRTGENLAVPADVKVNRMTGDGFFWYDTGQDHVLSNSVFRNCGYRSEEFSDYNNATDRGCGDSIENGCHSSSTTFGFLAHSDQFVPEIMQGTINLSFDNCGRRFQLKNGVPSTVSGRIQNWIDVDGSVTGFGEPSIIGSGDAATGKWWDVEAETQYDPQGPLRFIKQNNGPERGLAHFEFIFDQAVFDSVGDTTCGNGLSRGLSCNVLGHIQHMGPMFASDPGLPITENSAVVGPTGGFGWLMKLNQGAPHTAKINLVEVLPSTPLVLGIQYPLGTQFNVTAIASTSCKPNNRYICEESFQQVDSMTEVRNSPGNVYHFDNSTGLLTVRVIMMPNGFVGTTADGWLFPDFNTPGKWDNGFALKHFERAGVLLPIKSNNPWLQIEADCPRGTNDRSSFCDVMPPTAAIEVCQEGFEQVAYDKCCSLANPNNCMFASGSIEAA